MKPFRLLLIFFLFLAFFSCKEKKVENEGHIPALNNETEIQKENGTTNESYKVELVELGSVNCIPCKKMQPILASLQKKYGNQIKVTFYDVWKDPSPAQKFGIKLIPTQVFLDNNGVELLRHEGFFPEEEIDKFLQSKGLRITN